MENTTILEIKVYSEWKLYIQNGFSFTFGCKSKQISKID